MKNLVLLLTLLPFVAFSQLSTYKKGAKEGVKIGEHIIAKAKYDEVIIKDDSVATAFKKKKMFYINSQGDFIYKGLKADSEVFEEGLGIVKNKKGYFQLINRNGIVLAGGPLGISSPTRYGDYVFFQNNLYSNSGLIEKEIDSIAVQDNWLKVFLTATVVTVKTKKINLFKKEKTKEYSYYPYFNLFKLDEDKKLAGDVVKLAQHEGGIIIETADGFNHLYNQNGGLVEFGLSDLKNINQTYASAIKDSSLILINKSNMTVEIRGNYTSYEVKPGVIWGKGKNGMRQSIDIYRGSKLKVSGWNYIRDWDKERSVFKDSIGQFVAWNTGDIISKKYVNFDKPTGYFMLVQDSASYTWLDVDIFVEKPFHYPHILADVPVRAERKTGFFSIIPNIMHAFFGPKREADLPTNLEIVDAGHQFYDGWAICQVNVPSKNEPFDSAVYIGKVKNLKYNYINTSNKRLNDKKYSDCFPFLNGKAWVKERSDYYLIDKSGKKSGGLHFQSVELDENGLFIVDNFGSKGIVNSNYELVVPPRHFRIHRVGNKYYDNFTPDKKLLYEIP